MKKIHILFQTLDDFLATTFNFIALFFERELFLDRVLFCTLPWFILSHEGFNPRLHYNYLLNDSPKEFY